MSEEAKAVQEVAKFGQRSLDVFEKTGDWATAVFGEGVQNLAGAWADSTAGFRVRNLIRTLEKTRKVIDGSSFEGRLRLLPDRIAFPLLEAVSEESDETLQEVWAAYIRNAADPGKPQADRLLIDVIRRLEPIDWPVLQVIFGSGPRVMLLENLGRDEVQVETTMDRLAALGLFTIDDDTVVYMITERSEETPRLKIKGNKVTYEATRLLRALELATANATTASE